MEKVDKGVTECEEGLNEFGGQSGGGEDVMKGERREKCVKRALETLEGCESTRRDFGEEVCGKRIEIGA